MSESQVAMKKKGRGRGILSRLSTNQTQPSKPGPALPTAFDARVKLSDKNCNSSLVTSNNNDGKYSSSNDNSNSCDNSSNSSIIAATQSAHKEESFHEFGNVMKDDGRSNQNPKVVTNLQKGGMIAKYNYPANPNQPGGFPELSIKQGEPLKLVCKGHAKTNNHMWWEVCNEKGEQGFVPAKFCLILEEKLSTLPWLENKRLEDEKAEKERLAALSQEQGKRKDIGFGVPANYKPSVKQYVSSYSKENLPTARNAAEANKEFYCELCDKNLNGPQPYKMHMSSKAHREEVEYQKEKQQR